MNENGQFSKVSCVRFERLLPGPIERVFEFLTKPELLPGWFGNGVIEPRLGGKVSLMDGHIRGTVTQWLPPHRLSYSWNVFSPGEELSAHPQSYLTLELQPRGDEVLLTLTHLPILEPFEKQSAMGWHTFLDMLAAGLRSERVEERNAYMARNAERYGVDLERLAR